MAKKSQIDRALDALREKREAIMAKAATEAAGIDLAMQTLTAQRVKARVSRPRPVAAKEEKVG